MCNVPKVDARQQGEARHCLCVKIRAIMIRDIDI